MELIKTLDRRPDWEPCGDLMGVLTQIDNMTACGWRPDRKANIQHGLHDLSHTNKNGKYGDIMPDDERDVGKTKG